MGRGIDSRNRIWNWVAKLHRLAGRYNNPMPTWFLAPIAGLKLPTQTTRLAELIPRNRFLGSLEFYKFGHRLLSAHSYNYLGKFRRGLTYTFLSGTFVEKLFRSKQTGGYTSAIWVQIFGRKYNCSSLLFRNESSPGLFYLQSLLWAEKIEKAAAAGR